MDRAIHGAPSRVPHQVCAARAFVLRLSSGEAIIKHSIRSNSMQRRSFLKRLTLQVALATSGLALAPQILAADTIKVGVLHSLSATMAISETVLKDVTLMAIDEINAKGGVMGKKLELVVVDPA